MPPKLTSSPLSSLDTTDSHTSFATAAESPNGIQQEVITYSDNSPSAAEDERDDDPSDAGLPQYYVAKPLPPDLREHTRVYLEEALPRQAISFLANLLSTRPPNCREPAYCPPPSQIALLFSLTIHPDFTTRPKEPDWPGISLQSLVYLRDVLAVFGPINARFKEAILFNSDATSIFDRDSPPSDHQTSDADERGLVRLMPRFGSDSVWQRGRDFFRVLGWAFNCSVIYPERWKWWRRWVEFMVDIMEHDLYERHRLDEEAGEKNESALGESILALYLTQRSGRTADVLTWMMRAIFADGSAAATSVFQEIWPREYKSKLHHAANKRKRESVNIDQGHYGGYLDDESVPSSQASEPPTPHKERRRAETVEEQVLEAAFVETIPLRQRLFSLLSYLCYNLGKDSPIEIASLYEKFAWKIRDLPLAVFASFINTTTSALLVPQQIEVLQCVLSLLIPANALKPEKVDRTRANQGGISPVILERCFLPYPANTIEAVDNAKMSLLLENLVMIILQHGSEGDDFSDNLMDAVNKGIQARQDKIDKRKSRSRPRPSKGPEAEARAVLASSSSRLTWLGEAIQSNFVSRAGGDAMDED
ncbi:hypothetical protein GGS20DRAFT_276816 [Poronia punctata]|nr:hypothetical protein GGS20DRAFT_276816 [Poronia punctata]